MKVRYFIKWEAQSGAAGQGTGTIVDASDQDAVNKAYALQQDWARWASQEHPEIRHWVETENVKEE